MARPGRSRGRRRKLRPGGTVGKEAVMRISVVVNTYNRAASLRRTLDSLRRQTHPDFEVVVVDGPSTDATAAVLAEYAGAGPRPVLPGRPAVGVPQHRPRRGGGGGRGVHRRRLGRHPPVAGGPGRRLRRAPRRGRRRRRLRPDRRRPAVPVRRLPPGRPRRHVGRPPARRLLPPRGRPGRIPPGHQHVVPPVRPPGGRRVRRGHPVLLRRRRDVPAGGRPRVPGQAAGRGRRPPQVPGQPHPLGPAGDDRPVQPVCGTGSTSS